MCDSLGETAEIQRWLDRLRDGDPQAREELFARANDRLHRLARKMLKSFPGVRRREETDDVFQQAAIRLNRALLATTPPETPLHFFRLAALQIRRELIDMARQLGNELGSLPSGADPPVSTAGPATLAEWTEFHDAVERLPEDEREVFRLRFYMGVQVKDVAEGMGISERTVKRRWRSASLTVHQCWDGSVT